MQNLNMLDQERIKNLGDYCFNNEKMLSLFMAYQEQVEDVLGTCLDFEKIGFWLANVEHYLYSTASNLSSDYSGGFWSMNLGFFHIQSDQIFQVESMNGSTAALNALEFSIVCNLMALSFLSIATYEDDDPINNHLSVFFSEYIKEFMFLNREQLNTTAIYTLID